MLLSPQKGRDQRNWWLLFRGCLDRDLSFSISLDSCHEDGWKMHQWYWLHHIQNKRPHNIPTVCTLSPFFPEWEHQYLCTSAHQALLLFCFCPDGMEGCSIKSHCVSPLVQCRSQRLHHGSHVFVPSSIEPLCILLQYAVVNNDTLWNANSMCYMQDSKEDHFHLHLTSQSNQPIFPNVSTTQCIQRICTIPFPYFCSWWLYWCIRKKAVLFNKHHISKTVSMFVTIASLFHSLSLTCVFSRFGCLLERNHFLDK